MCPLHIKSGRLSYGASLTAKSHHTGTFIARLGLHSLDKILTQIGSPQLSHINRYITRSIDQLRIISISSLHILDREEVELENGKKIRRSRMQFDCISRRL